MITLEQAKKLDFTRLLNLYEIVFNDVPNTMLENLDDVREKVLIALETKNPIPSPKSGENFII